MNNKLRDLCMDYTFNNRYNIKIIHNNIVYTANLTDYNLGRLDGILPTLYAVTNKHIE